MSDHQRRIVCAANRWGDLVIPSVRHYDMLMHNVIAGIGAGNLPPGKEEQGFVDNMGRFLSRAEAYCVAVAAGQIKMKSGNPKSTELFSEDLY